jgi:hypothetical protein
MCSPPRDRVTFILFILRDATVTRQQIPHPATSNAASAAILGQFPWYLQDRGVHAWRVRDLIQESHLATGAGRGCDDVFETASLDLAYGKHPVSFQIFLRMRPGRSEQQHHGH